MGETNTNCRLCEGQTAPLFEALVRNRHTAIFAKCRTCGSVQAADPTWVDESYSAATVSRDTGAALRCLRNLAALSAMSMSGLVQRRRQLIDYGGGSGLLCRLLRDAGFDAWSLDPYSKPEFSSGFSVDKIGSPATITAFEVAEHLA